jgi:hypothetical protein
LTPLAHAPLRDWWRFALFTLYAALCIFTKGVAAVASADDEFLSEREWL